MKSVGKFALSIAKSIQQDAPQTYVPPSEGTRPLNQTIIPHAMVLGTRRYIERVTFQINGCYENGWYDGCAVMMRRLIETLIIECFENNGISNKIIIPQTGDFVCLQKMVNRTLKEAQWNLGRQTKRALPNFKTLGDQSAHSRRFNARREDIDRIAFDYRIVCEELLYVAGLK